MRVLVYVATNLIKFDYLSIYCLSDLSQFAYRNTRIFGNLCCESYNIIILTETWLINSISNSKLFGDRYKVYRRNKDIF